MLMYFAIFLSLSLMSGLDYIFSALDPTRFDTSYGRKKPQGQNSAFSSVIIRNFLNGLQLFLYGIWVLKLFSLCIFIYSRKRCSWCRLRVEVRVAIQYGGWWFQFCVFFVTLIWGFGCTVFRKPLHVLCLAPEYQNVKEVPSKFHLRLSTGQT